MPRLQQVRVLRVPHQALRFPHVARVDGRAHGVPQRQLRALRAVLRNRTVVQLCISVEQGFARVNGRVHGVPPAPGTPGCRAIRFYNYISYTTKRRSSCTRLVKSVSQQALKAYMACCSANSERSWLGQLQNNVQLHTYNGQALQGSLLARCLRRSGHLLPCE